MTATLMTGSEAGLVAIVRPATSTEQSKVDAALDFNWRGRRVGRQAQKMPIPCSTPDQIIDPTPQ
ncbi:MAG: hypothetical protein Q9175_005092 [Cornicularia normoerica]